MRIGQTSFLLFLTKVLSSALGFLATVYFARVLGEETLGHYYLVVAVVVWLAVGGNLGITKAVKKRVSEGQEPRRFVGAAVALMGAMVVVLTLLLMVFRERVDEYVGAEVVEFVILLLIARLLLALVAATFEGRHMVHVSGLLRVLEKGIQVALQVGLVILGFELFGMLIGYVAAAFIAASVGVVYLGLRPSRPDRYHLTSLIDFAKFSWLSGMRSKTFSYVDVIVLGFFVPTGLIGIYSIAWSVSKFLDLFSTSINATLFPEISKVAAAGDTDAVTKLTEDALAYAGLFLIPGLVGAVVVGDRLLLIYGSAFQAGYAVLGLLTTAVLLYSYKKQLLNTLNAINRPDLAFRANAFFIGANVLLNVILVQQFGWIGAAVATGLAAGIGLALAYYYARAQVQFRVPVAEIMRQVTAALVMGVVVLGARSAGESTVVATHNVAFVVSLVGFGAVVYLSVLMAISTKFRTVVFRNIPFENLGIRT